MAIATFEKGSAVYACAKCGKATRNVGVSTRHCKKCAVVLMAENSHRDEGHVGAFADCEDCKMAMRAAK